MLEIMIIMGTRYAYNLKSESDHICLQFLSKGTKYSCNHQNFVIVRLVQKSQLLILQPYLVSIERDCKHIWSDSDLRLRAYLVPIVFSLQAYLFSVIKIIATICGPTLSTIGYSRLTVTQPVRGSLSMSK